MSAPGRLVIGTRGSPLALWQADHIAAALLQREPGLQIEREIIVTSGDRFQSGPVERIGGKAVWVKEIEEALLERRIDLAVHSLKDVPGEVHEGLVLAAFPERADPRDAWLSRSGASIADLPAGSRVGTSSPRRAAQLRVSRPDLRIDVLRGNVDTRLRKLSDGVVDATVLACAGLDRLGYADRIVERLAPQVMVPAIGQGVLAIEIRDDDQRLHDLCQHLNHAPTAYAVAAERALLAGLGGSCRTPIGGHAETEGNRVRLRGLVARPDGRVVIRIVEEGSIGEAAAIGARAANTLMARGAGRILQGDNAAKHD